MQDALPLDRWANFYLIASAAAATLIGLLFVAITLAADRRPDEAGKIRLYLTPTVVYFGSVLLLAALFTFPTQSRLTASLTSGVAGALGLAYAATVAFGGGAQRHRYNEPSDVVQYLVLPAAAYGLLVLGGVELDRSQPGRGLTLIALGMLALIALGLRNSWSIAVTLVSAPPSAAKDPQKQEVPRPEA